MKQMYLCCNCKKPITKTVYWHTGQHNNYAWCITCVKNGMRMIT